jgi:hypothetical protein
MRRNLSLKKKYLEAISSQTISLSLSNIARFYNNYISNNLSKVESELNRVGYFTLKNKLSIGDNEKTTKDVYITTYFVNMERAEECSEMLAQKYHGDTDVRQLNGFFVPSTNELVIIVRVEGADDNVLNALKRSDIRSTIEHELTHAFDSTNRSKLLADQNPAPGVGGNFLSMCAYLGCATREDVMNLLGDDLFSGGRINDCIYSISLILYKLFTLTEFNAHQMSDLDYTHNVDINRSDKVRAALKKDINYEQKLTKQHLDIATKVTPDDSPYLWRLVGNVLSYMGYDLKNKSPKSVYNFFNRESKKLFKKYYDRKVKNQVKLIISLREKNNIKNKLSKCIEDNKLSKGFSFWFSPAGSTDSFLCRISAQDNKLNINFDRSPIRIYGNANGMLARAISALNNNDDNAYDFALDNLTDIIVQSIERNFNIIDYEPVYDITAPQDETQISKSNQRANRFADLDWD